MGVFKKGNNWYVDYYLKGIRKRKKIGPSKKLAEQVLKDIQVKIVKNEYLGVLEEKKVLFKDFARIYLDYSRTNKAVSSFKRDSVSLNSLLPVFEDKFIFEIVSQMVEEYKTKRLKESVTSATINREVSCLRHMFNKAVEWKFVRNNPVRGVRLLKEPPGRIRYLEKAEIARLFEVMDSLPRHTGSYLKPIVLVALNTGLRKREILSLKHRDIDFDKRRITVFRTKTNELRTVPMNETLYRELKKISREDESEYLFCNGKGEPYGNVRKSFESALKASGIEEFRFHDLRHTFASHLVMNGCDIRTVQQLMGHKDIKMTMRYSHLSKAHLQEAVEKLDSSWTLYGHQAGFGTDVRKSKRAVNASKSIS